MLGVPRAFVPLLLLSGLLVGCGSRHSTAVDAQRGNSDGGMQLDAALDSALARCNASGALPSLGPAAINLQRSSVGDWALALHKDLGYQPITIVAARRKEAAAAFDYSVAYQQIAGFIVSVPTTQRTALAQLQLAGKIVVTDFAGGTVVQDNGGRQTQTHDGHDAVLRWRTEIRYNGSGDVSRIRNQLVALLLGRGQSELKHLPAPSPNANGEFIFSLSTILRPDGRAIYLGVVADRSDYLDPAKLTARLFDEIGGASGLAHAGASLELGCETLRTGTKPKVDLIWVVDESGSMRDRRDRIARSADELFGRAVAAGIDFRMGVTNVNASSAAFAGRFCSRISSDANDDGGADRFLSANEAPIFAACIKNPPGWQAVGEYGLMSAVKAITRHRPKEAQRPDRLRPDAEVVVIVIGDEVPLSLSLVIGELNLDKCVLPQTVQQALDKELLPLIDFFSGKSAFATSGQRATMHFIGGLCGSRCQDQKPNVGHGYLEMVQQTGGSAFDICQADFNRSMQNLVDLMATNASPLTLAQQPIVASLQVALDNVVLPAHGAKRYSYDVASQAIALVGVDFQAGSTVLAAYYYWESDPPTS